MKPLAISFFACLIGINFLAQLPEKELREVIVDSTIQEWKMGGIVNMTFFPNKFNQLVGRMLKFYFRQCPDQSFCKVQ